MISVHGIQYGARITVRAWSEQPIKSPIDTGSTECGSRLPHPASLAQVPRHLRLSFEAKFMPRCDPETLVFSRALLLLVDGIDCGDALYRMTVATKRCLFLLPLRWNQKRHTSKRFWFYEPVLFLEPCSAAMPCHAMPCHSAPALCACRPVEDAFTPAPRTQPNPRSQEPGAMGCCHDGLTDTRLLGKPPPRSAYLRPPSGLQGLQGTPLAIASRHSGGRQQAAATWL